MAEPKLSYLNFGLAPFDLQVYTASATNVGYPLVLQMAKRSKERRLLSKTKKFLFYFLTTLYDDLRSMGKVAKANKCIQDRVAKTKSANAIYYRFRCTLVSF